MCGSSLAVEGEEREGGDEANVNRPSWQVTRLVQVTGETRLGAGRGASLLMPHQVLVPVNLSTLQLRLALGTSRHLQHEARVTWGITASGTIGVLVLICYVDVGSQSCIV